MFELRRKPWLLVKNLADTQAGEIFRRPVLFNLFHPHRHPHPQFLVLTCENDDESEED
jgi:hypothetical protein